MSLEMSIVFHASIQARNESQGLCCLLSKNTNQAKCGKTDLSIDTQVQPLLITSQMI